MAMANPQTSTTDLHMLGERAFLYAAARQEPGEGLQLHTEARERGGGGRGGTRQRGWGEGEAKAN